jgi:hypothetical protein
LSQVALPTADWGGPPESAELEAIFEPDYGNKALEAAGLSE